MLDGTYDYIVYILSTQANASLLPLDCGAVWLEISVYKQSMYFEMIHYTARPLI